MYVLLNRHRICRWCRCAYRNLILCPFCACPLALPIGHAVCDGSCDHLLPDAGVEAGPEAP